MDTVTVIVLNWNQYDITYACLKSVFLSQKIEIQVVLIDNGSQDDSSKKLSEDFQEVELVQISVNRGYSQGCNEGLRHAFAQYPNKYAIFVSNDTILDPLCIYNLVQSSKNNDNSGLVVPKIFFYDKPTTIWYAGGVINKFIVEGRHIGFNMKDSGQFNVEKEVTFGNGCVFLATRDAIEKTGYFDTSFVSYAEDVDFSIRIRQNGFKIIYSPASMVWHRIAYTTTEFKSINKVVYYSLRNTIWLQKKYPEELSPFGLLLNICSYIIKYTIRSIIKRDWATLKILSVAIVDGYKNKSRAVK